MSKLAVVFGDTYTVTTGCGPAGDTVALVGDYAHKPQPDLLAGAPSRPLLVIGQFVYHTRDVASGKLSGVIHQLQ